MADLRRAGWTVKHFGRQILRRGTGTMLGPRVRRRGRGIILAYHSIGGLPAPCYPGNLVSRRQFDNHLELVRASNRPLVSIEQMLSGEAVDGVALSFDDGYRSCLTEVAPRLLAVGIPATFFVCPGWIDDGAGKWDDLLYLAAARDGVVFRKDMLRRPWRDIEPDLRQLRARHPDLASRSAEDLMGWQDVQDLVEQGFEIGSHTLSHPFLTAETASDQRHEMVESRRRLEQKLGHEVRLLAYPFGYPGSFDRQTMRAAKAAGYSAAVASGNGYLEANQEPFSVPRFAVGPQTSTGWLKLVLSGHYV